MLAELWESRDRKQLEEPRKCWTTILQKAKLLYGNRSTELERTLTCTPANPYANNWSTHALTNKWPISFSISCICGWFGKQLFVFNYYWIIISYSYSYYNTTRPILKSIIYSTMCILLRLWGTLLRARRDVTTNKSLTYPRPHSQTDPPTLTPTPLTDYWTRYCTQPAYTIALAAHIF